MFSLRRLNFIHLIPGVVACVAVAVLAHMLARVEAHMGRVWIEPLVLAIVLGALIRAVWTPGGSFTPGITFSAKMVLEVAVALLGASISVRAVMQEGWSLVIGVAVLVPVAIVVSYIIGRVLGLTPRVATLAACGNAICGNSAIAAVAPVIGATGAEVASAIAFTALLGIVVVLALPLALSYMSVSQYGTLAGLTVYAVPQVLAAAASGGTVAVHIGTIVKLLRVLMLGPVVIGLSLMRRGEPRVSISGMVPWFIVAFVILMVLPIGPVPAAWMAKLSALLTVLAMAALGLQCDVRAVARAGARVSIAVSLSMVVLALMSYGLIRLLGIA